MEHVEGHAAQTTDLHVSWPSARARALSVNVQRDNNFAAGIQFESVGTDGGPCKQIEDCRSMDAT